jgi:uncharacterized membrane protein (UPF0127 family)
MSGQAIVTINENQWSVSLATTYDELTAGLGGVASIPAGTGMLFMLPEKRAVTVTTSAMLFNIDIVFISDGLVVDAVSDVEPGYLVTEQTPCDMFLEVNAGEAAAVEPGDGVTTEIIQQPGTGLDQIISIAVPLALLGFVCAAAGGVIKLASGSEHHNPGHHSENPGRFKNEATVKCPICQKEIKIPEYDRVTRSEALIKHLETEHSGGHHSNPITPKEYRVRFIGACKVVDGLCHSHGYSVSKEVKCPESELTQQEWQAAWELAQEAFPEGQHNPWVDGWWPKTREEAEMVVRRYESKMVEAVERFRARQQQAIENYEKAAAKAVDNYRRYVMREYRRGRELSAVA